LGEGHIIGPQPATPLINPIGFCRVQLSRHLAGEDAVGSEGDDYADVIAPGFLQNPEARQRLNGSSPPRPGRTRFHCRQENLTTGPRRPPDAAQRPPVAQRYAVNA
jgi:hypothetical protein